MVTVVNSDSNYETHCCTRARVWVQLSHENGVLSMVTKFNASCSHVEWCKFYIHLRSLNIRHFGMVEATRLKILASRPPSRAWCPAEFDESLLISAIVFSWGPADRQRGELISPTSNVVLKWLTLLLHIPEVPFSNLCPETSCSVWGFVFFLSPSGHARIVPSN
jgi:hypothetical protein